jgi:hypothetical protein
VTILVATELIHDLRDRRPWVVLAPSDDVFEGLPRGWVEGLFEPANVEALIDLAENHVCVASSDPARLVTLLGEQVGELSRIGHRLTSASGAVIEVDRLLLPRSLGGWCASSPREPRVPRFLPERDRVAPRPDSRDAGLPRFPSRPARLLPRPESGDATLPRIRPRPPAVE